MKKIRLFPVVGALVASMVMSSCEKVIIDADDIVDTEIADTNNGKGELYVSCSFSQSLSEMSAGAAKEMNVVTRAASIPLYECANRVQFVIMKDGVIVHNAEQINGGGSSFGTLSVNLDPGTYRLMVFAHNEAIGNPVAVGTDGSIQGYNGRATDSFSYSDEVVITKDKRKAVSCKLTRCVAQVYFSSTDEVPSEVTKFKMTLTGVSSKYDLKNQIGADAASYATGMVDIGRWTSKAGLFANVNSYVFLPAIEANINAKFEFFNDNGDLLLTRNIENIQARINAKTTVTGGFFQSDGIDATVTVDNDWGEGISVEV